MWMISVGGISPLLNEEMRFVIRVKCTMLIKMMILLIIILNLTSQTKNSYEVNIDKDNYKN